MATTLAKLVVAFMLVAVTPSVRAVQHIVGGSNGWTSGGDYDTWAAGQTFTVGDTLLFNYGFNHGVDQVNQADYRSCSSGNALASYSGGQTTVTLSSPGPMYFICPTAGHCSGQGMKLSVNVVAASSGGGSGSPPTSPSGGSPGTGSPPTSPSGGSPGISSPPTETTSPPAGSSPPSPSSTNPTPAAPNGAAAGFGNMNQLVIGFSVVVAVVISCMV